MYFWIDDPYENPVNPELSINTSEINQEEAVNQVVEYLVKEGFLV